MEKQRFELKEEHIKLLNNTWISWVDFEFGAPTIDPKRPYGNSLVYEDMIEILDWKVIEIDNEKYIISNYEDKDLPQPIINKLDKLHKELKIALQVILRSKSFKTGLYEADKFNINWKYVKK